VASPRSHKRLEKSAIELCCGGSPSLKVLALVYVWYRKCEFYTLPEYTRAGEAVAGSRNKHYAVCPVLAACMADRLGPAGKPRTAKL
jgi:hypothetical protein